MIIELLRRDVPVQKLHWDVQARPTLWNRVSLRTAGDTSPHRELDDIWVRYGDEQRALDDKPHDAHWYPAANEIPGIKDLCHDLMRLVNGTKLGGVLITRIPPGAQCYPHVDNAWHAKHYAKVAVQIASAPGQVFCFKEKVLETAPGDVYTFNNQLEHWVINPTPYERVTLIVCIRVED